jgi:hypothetical protein
MQNMMKHFSLYLTRIIYAPKLLYAIGMLSYNVSDGEKRKKYIFPAGNEFSSNAGIHLPA